MAYDSHAKLYTHFTRAVPDSWVAAQERLTEIPGRGCLKTSGLAKPFKGRTTVTVKSASQFTAKYEYLDPNGSYVTLVEGTATKVAP